MKLKADRGGFEACWEERGSKDDTVNPPESHRCLAGRLKRAKYSVNLYNEFIQPNPCDPLDLFLFNRQVAIFGLSETNP